MQEYIIDDFYKFRKIDNDFSIECFPNDLPLLYHYTSPEGLKGILESGKLWFTDADYLNDYSEGKYILDVLQSATEEWCKEKGYSGKKEIIKYVNSIDSIENEGIYQFHDDLSYVKNGQLFICSFSKNQDSLPMWNYYAKETKYHGYNLCFDSSYLTEIDSPKVKLISVNYDKEKQVGIIKGLLNRLNDYYDGTSENRRYALMAFYDALIKMKYSFKNPCFAYEEEVRATVIISGNELPRKKRSGVNKSSIPYIEVPYLIENVDITLGPLLNDEKVISSLTEFIKSLGKEVTIQKSKCPIRY